jgi:SOS-response transcriptional repressor LexA
MQTSQSAVARLESRQHDAQLSTLTRYAEALGLSLKVADVDTPDAQERVPQPASGQAVESAIDGLDIPSQEAAYVPLVGRIAAGGPILAEEQVEDILPLRRWGYRVVTALTRRFALECALTPRLGIVTTWSTDMEADNA